MHTTPLLWLYPPGLDTWLFSVHVIHQACSSMGLLALLGRWSLCFLIVVACWAVKSSQLHQHLKLHLVALYRMKLLCFCYLSISCSTLSCLHLYLPSARALGQADRMWFSEQNDAPHSLQLESSPKPNSLSLVRVGRKSVSAHIRKLSLPCSMGQIA